MRLAVLSLLLLLSGACAPDREPPRAPQLSIRDSIRVRREAAVAVRPDTFGTRVDSLRIVRGPTPAARTAPWVVVISDFQCQACRRLALEVLPAIRRDIVERGVAQLAFVNAPREEHFSARFAAHAALCAASAGRFWEMHDSLFASLPRWDRTPDPQPFMDSLAISAGVPDSVQLDCSRRQRLLRVLEGDIRRSERAGATELPVVFVGERRLRPDERSIDGMRAAIVAATPPTR